MQKMLGYGRATAVELIVELFEMSELNCPTKTRAYIEARNVLEVQEHVHVHGMVLEVHKHVHGMV